MHDLGSVVFNILKIKLLCHPVAGPRDPGSANLCLRIIRFTPGFRRVPLE